MTRETALVLGATGGIGGEVARQLRDAGWHVRGLRRSVAASEQTDGIEWIHGDAMNRADVTRAAKGATVIVHAVNPPGYKRWADFVLPMLDNTIAAAKTERATIVLPGTVYNFGPDAFPAIAEDAPQNPVTKKGAIRVEMEARLERASREGVQTLIVRAGDFFGPKGATTGSRKGSSSRESRSKESSIRGRRVSDTHGHICRTWHAPWSNCSRAAIRWIGSRAFICAVIGTRTARNSLRPFNAWSRDNGASAFDRRFSVVAAHARIAL